MRYVSLLVVAAVFLSACTDTEPIQSNLPSLNALISDGAHLDVNGNGNKDFFFLPPLVSNPVGSQFYSPGKFNRNLAPTAEVCQLLASPILVPTTDCMPGPLVFGPARMTLDASNEQYQFNWDTKTSPLSSTAFYRITVRGAARGTPLGFLDVDPVFGGMKNAKTGDVFVFQDGRTLPIKVRIEQGAFGSTNSDDFVEQVVPVSIPSGALDVTTNTGFAGARFSDGWLRSDLGIDQVVVIIERAHFSNGTCLHSDLEEMQGCYRFRTDPDLHLIEGALPFVKNVTAGVCFQVPGHDENSPPFELTRREEVEGQPSGPLTRLQEVAAPFLRCDGFGPATQTIGQAFRSGRLGDIARAGWRAVTRTIARAIEPTALHAVDLGAGGSTDGFSFFGYVRFATVTGSVNPASAPAGSTVQATATVLSDHHGHHPPVSAQSVTFTIATGGGTVSTPDCPEGNSCTVPTGTDGTATVSWKLGPDPMVNTIQVTTNNVTNSPQVITATGTPNVGRLVFLQQPTNTPSGQWITPALQIQALDAAGHPMTDIVRITVGNDPDNPSSCQVLQTSQDAINGVATFSNVVVDGTCTGARLAARGGGGGLTFPIIVSNQFDITLPQVSLSVDLSSGNVPLEGSVSYAAHITNGGRTGLSGVLVQGYVDQGNASRAAGFTMLSSCGTNLGDLPPGPCNQSWSLNPSNTNAGTGTLIAGPATARIFVVWSGATVATVSVPITITVPGTPLQ